MKPQGFRGWGGVCLLIVGAAAVSAAQPPSLVEERARTVACARGGTAQTFKIASTILKETRRVLVFLPASYEPSAAERRYPVTVVLDGEFLLPVVAAVSDELVRNGQIPESVLIGIENAGGANDLAANDKRVDDLTPPGLSVSGSDLQQGGDRFLDFIERELLPALDRQFRTAAPRFLIGHSSGGILATYAAATRPTYGAVVSLDAPVHLGGNWLAKKLSARSQAGGRPVRYASLEAKFGWPEGAWKELLSAAPASWTLYREKFPSEGHETIPMLGAYIGLRQVFRDYSRLSAPESPTTSILPYYAKVGASLDAPVLPPKRLLRNVVDDLLMEGRGAAAREAYNSLVFGYGAPAESARLLKEIAEVERRPPPTETVESLLAVPFPTPDEVRPFLGEWRGDIWMNPNEPREGRQSLRIRVAEGRVVGETVHRLPNGEELVQPWTYLKITPQGLMWGYLNGMRPRGLLLFAGVFKGDTLSGTMQFAGVNFKFPDGSTPPPLYFAFQKIAGR